MLIVKTSTRTTCVWQTMFAGMQETEVLLSNGGRSRTKEYGDYGDSRL